MSKESRNIISYFNNVMKFDKDYKFEEYDEKTSKNGTIVDFNEFSMIPEMIKKFEECDENIRPEFKLTTILPTILNYKLRGILDISQQFVFNDSNLGSFIEYDTKQKPIPTLEGYVDSIKSLCKSDKMKIRIFNLVFPHGIHEKSKLKSEKDLKGIDKIYLQKIGILFDKVLELICKGKDEKIVTDTIKQIIAEKVCKGPSKNQFKSTISGINIENIIETIESTEETPEMKEKQKALQKTIKSYKEEVQQWILETVQEIRLAKKVFMVIYEGLEQNGLDKKSLMNYYKKYLDQLSMIQSLGNQSVKDNFEFVSFCRLVINTGNEVFGDNKGISLLIDSKANIKTLLSRENSKKFDNGEDLDDESVMKLFETKNETTRTKYLQRIIESKSVPLNIKVALGIYITNQFYELVQKESSNKSWQRRTFYVKF